MENKSAVLLVVLGVVLGIVLVIRYNATSFALNHRCAYTKTEEVYDPSAGDVRDERTCGYWQKTGPTPGPARVLFSIPSDFIAGRTDGISAVAVWIAIPLVWFFGIPLAKSIHGRWVEWRAGA